MRKTQMKEAEFSYIHKPLWWFLFLTPFCFGLYYEFTAAFVGVILMAYCLFIAIKRKEFTVYLNLEGLAIFTIVIGYLMVSIWAVDRGMAWTGFLKFFPLIPFWCILMQIDSSQRQKLFSSVPLSGVLMTVLSYPTKWMGEFGNNFFSAERLGGFFQYSNSFALFLLLGIIILAFDNGSLWMRLSGIAILTFGILATGSRTVFIILVVAILVIAVSNKKIRWQILGIIVVFIVLALSIVFLTNNTQTIGRFLTSSFTESTFLGRVLYWKDAIPVIASHPFGLGYLGYFFTQSSFQTGLYTVRFVHNEFLQFFLDIGWVPSLLFIAALLKNLFSKKNDMIEKLILFAVCAHCFFDFDLQFLNIFFVLILVLTGKKNEGKTFSLNKTEKYLIGVGAFIISCIFIYFGYAIFNSYIGNHERAVKLFPGNTSSQIMLLAYSSSSYEADVLSEKIISQNKFIPLAYDAKALLSFINGDYEGMISYKEKSIDIAPYVIAEYEDYYNLLNQAILESEKKGDIEMMEKCKEKLKSLPEIMQTAENKASSIAWKLEEKPTLELPLEAIEYIKKL